MRSTAGLIRIRSNPVDARVQINGEYGPTVGRTPFDTLLEPALYMFAISKPGHKTEIKDIRLPEGDTVNINVDLVKAYQCTQKITSKPSGARVEIDGADFTGITHVDTVLSVFPGKYSFSFSADGYVDTVIEEQIVWRVWQSDDGTCISMNVRLEKVPDKKKVRSPNAQGYSDLNISNKSNREWKSSSTRNSIIGKYIIDDPFTFYFDPASLLLHFSTNSTFNNMSEGLHSDFIIPNDYGTFNLLNSIGVSLFNLHANLELGQWWNFPNGSKEAIMDSIYSLREDPQGRYRITDIISIDSTLYAFINDTSSNNDHSTAMKIRSTSLSLAISLPIAIVRFLYGIGYQWEDVTYENVVRFSDNDYELIDLTFDNDFWFQVFRLEVGPLGNDIARFGPFIEIRDNISKGNRTNWFMFKIGLHLRFFDKGIAE